MAESPFWNALLTRRDAIANIDPGASDAHAQLLAQLTAVSAAYGGTFDPAENFEAYVSVSLCQALERVLLDLPPAHRGASGEPRG